MSHSFDENEGVESRNDTYAIFNFFFSDGDKLAEKKIKR